MTSYFTAARLAKGGSPLSSKIHTGKKPFVEPIVHPREQRARGLVCPKEDVHLAVGMRSERGSAGGGPRSAIGAGVAANRMPFTNAELNKIYDTWD
jgi:hypothetical protein